jgi:hypothetical protein
MPCDNCKKPRPSPSKPTRCFCGGNITDEETEKAPTGADKVRADVQKKQQEVQAKKVKYSTTFAAHLFTGEADGTKHKGLHSLVRLRAGGKKDAFELKKIAGDADTGAYSAWARLPGYTAWKASTFFPDAWREDQVLSAIETAYQEYRVKKGMARAMITGKGLTWAAYVTVHGASLWIGGLGDGDAQTGLSTAFPAVNDSFDDPNDGDPPA